MSPAVAGRPDPPERCSDQEPLRSVHDDPVLPVRRADSWAKDGRRTRAREANAGGRALPEPPGSGDGTIRGVAISGDAQGMRKVRQHKARALVSSHTCMSAAQG